MTTVDIHERLTARFGDAIGAPPPETKGDLWLTVKADRLIEVATFLRDEPGIELDLCEDLTALDWPKRNVIEVVIHLFSYRHKHGVTLKVEADRAAPVVPSLDGVWKAANWFEREVYDLFGVTFTGHPDLRRLLLPDDWIGHPLRKDYQEAGGWHGIDNVRENPLVELRRLDLVRLAEHLKANPPPPPPPPAPPPAAAPPAGTPPAPATPPAAPKA